MLQLTPRYVGTAPGTTTLTIPSAAMTAPSVAQMAPTPRSLDGSLGTVYPTDFDVSRMYGYLPYNTGWIVGTLHQPERAPSGKPAHAMYGLGQTSFPGMSPEQMQLVALQTKLVDLDVKTREEELRTRRSDRIWNAVTGLVAVGGLVVSIYALRKAV